MGTKSIFTIIDGDDTFRVYMSDDYPYEAYEPIKKEVLKFPRLFEEFLSQKDFEAKMKGYKDHKEYFKLYPGRDFGEAFLSANKRFSNAYPGGEVHLTQLHRECDDLEFRYELFINDNETYIREYEIDYRKELRLRGRERLLFEGSLEEFFNTVDYMDEESAKYEVFPHESA